ncbi:MAG: tetratricopeptide repeat protein [bacterium]|nr:tetratricopeptide repeat protein [bacterium]
MTWQAFRASKAEVDALAKKELAERQTARAESSERRALAEAARSNAISRFLRNDLLGLEANSTFLNTEVKFDPDLKLISLLERAREQLGERFEGQPNEKRQIQSLLIESYCSIGRYDIASDLLRPIVEQLSAGTEPDQAKVIEGIKLLVTLELQQGKWGRARPLLERLLSHTQNFLGRDHAETQKALNNLATAARMIGDYDAAHERYQQLLDLGRRVDGVESPAALSAKEYLAVVASKLGNVLTAEQRLTEVLSSRRKNTTLAKSMDTTLHNLGEFYLEREQYAQAKPLLSEAAKLQRQRLEVGSPHIMTTQFCLATAQLGQGQVGEAESVRNAFVDFFQTNLKLTSMATVEQILMHAELLQAGGDWASAKEILQLAVAILEFHELDSSDTARKTRAALGECLSRTVEFECK